MITGEIKNKIDAIWSTFWESAGITNPMDVLSQMTYLFFMKMLDDTQVAKEATASIFGGEIADPTFPEGEWTHPDSTDDRPIRIPYRDLRWRVFSQLSSENMFDRVRNYVFPFIKTLGHGSGSAYSRYMGDAVFLIQKPRPLQRIVQQIDGLDMQDRDTMGDVYEYILGKMASSGQNGQFRTPRHIIRMMVELMQPSIAKRDRVCDPAMGSAGFIVEALAMSPSTKVPHSSTPTTSTASSRRCSPPWSPPRASCRSKKRKLFNLSKKDFITYECVARNT